MPIEIKELVIKGVIGNEGGRQGGEGAAGELSEEQKKAIITACVEKVLQVLADKKER